MLPHRLGENINSPFIDKMLIFKTYKALVKLNNNQNIDNPI